MRYYEQKYPEVDELVMVQVRQIAEMGAYVKLVRSSSVVCRERHDLTESFSRLRRRYRARRIGFGSDY